MTPDGEVSSRTNAMGSGDVKYSHVLPEHLQAEGPWTVRRHWREPDALRSRFSPPLDNIRTLYELFESAVAVHGDRPFLGRRNKAGAYEWLTYSQAARARDNLASCLRHLGLHPRSRLGLYGVNCPEWDLFDVACAAQSIVTVPLYDTLGADAVRYICSHADVSAVACSVQVLPILQQCIAQCPTVSTLIVWGADTAALPKSLDAGRCQVLSYDEAIEIGQSNPCPHHPPDASDAHTICYTSGTTGVPKGVVLTHGNLIANAAGIHGYLKIEPTDVYVSYLPLAHIYERINHVDLAIAWQLVQIACGAGIGFYSGDVLNLLEDIQALKPTIFASVPRLWNRIYDKITTTIAESGMLGKLLFDTAFNSRLRTIESGQRPGGVIDALWDRLIFSKIREKLGGRIRYMITGASPISMRVFNFLRVCFTPYIMEGYGMTEAACVISLTQLIEPARPQTVPGDPVIGHVGGPTPSMEIKLADIPEMEYTNADRPYPRGEICVRGPPVFQGYYKDKAQTRDVLDEEGWLHTGDVGMWVEGGRLRIIDRKKNIFKLSQGEYVAPEKIEQVYQRCPLVQQCFVHGHSLKPNLVAVAVPDPEVVVPWAKKRGLPVDMEALCRNETVIEAVLQGMLQEGSAAELRGFEQIAAVTLRAEPFSVEEGLLTPTFKIKRPQAAKMFEREIASMYRKLSR